MRLWLNDNDECTAYVDLYVDVQETIRVIFYSAGKPMKPIVPTDVWLTLHDGDDTVALLQEVRKPEDVDDALQAIDRLRMVLDAAERRVLKAGHRANRGPTV
jgi:hypothetical protein